MTSKISDLHILLTHSFNHYFLVNSTNKPWSVPPMHFKWLALFYELSKSKWRLQWLWSSYRFCINVFDFYCYSTHPPNCVWVLFGFFFFFLNLGTKQECSSISKGVLMVEHFSWKCVTPGELLLKMHTSATKATVLNLPVGYVWVFTSVLIL